MSQTEFEKHKYSLIREQSKSVINLGRESNHLWSYIQSEYYDFDLVPSFPHSSCMNITEQAYSTSQCGSYQEAHEGEHDGVLW
jgi:hypothetical protein